MIVKVLRHFSLVINIREEDRGILDFIWDCNDGRFNLKDQASKRPSRWIPFMG